MKGVVKTKKFISFVMTFIMLSSSAVFAADCVTLIKSDGQSINYYSSKTFWDLSFDSTYSIPSTGSLYVKDDGNSLMIAPNLKEFSEPGNMASDYVTLHVGNSNLNRGLLANATTDPQVANEDHDYFVKLETTSNSEETDGAIKYGYDYEVQMNQMPIRAKEGIVVVQNDFAIGKFPTGSNYIRISTLQLNDGSLNSYNTNSCLSAVYVMANGAIKVGDTKTSFTIAKNEWHTATQVVDFDNKNITYYIDGLYAGKLSRKNIGALWKFTVYHPKGGGDELVSYVDNIKVFRTTENMVAIDYEDMAATNVEGSPVLVRGFKLDGPDISSVKIFSSNDGMRYSLFSEESSVVVCYKNYATYYKAVGYDSDGNEICQCEPIKLISTLSEDKGVSYWDVDFNHESYSMKNSRVAFGGEYITSSTGYNFITNAGNGAKVEIREATDDLAEQNGRSIVLDNSLCTEPSSSTGAQTQINELMINSTDNILVVEYDFAYNEPPTVASNTVGRLEGSYADTDENRYFDNSTVLSLNSSGKLFLSSLGTGKSIDTTPYTWYHIRQVINLEEQKTDTYVDGEYLATLDFTAGKNWTKIRRFSATTGVSAGADQTYRPNTNILYYDNFKIYSVAEKEIPGLAIEKVKYFIDGEEAKRISDGYLTGELTVLNQNATECSVNCILAIYSSYGKLKKVSVAPLCFDANEATKITDLDFGEVTSTDMVKIFLWND